MPYLLKSIYYVFTLICAPLVYCYLKYKKTIPPYGNDITQLKGVINKNLPSNPIWFHTVSVGESRGAIPLIKELTKHFTQNVIVTTSTTTAKKIYADAMPTSCHSFAPIDSPFYIARFFKKVKPQALIIMETELWPNILAYAHKHQIPVILINARLSLRSKNRYKKLSATFNTLIANHLTHIICQHQSDYDAYSELGIPKTKLSITGSLKYDIEPAITNKLAGENLKQLLPNKKIICLASSHEQEERIFLEAFSKLKKEIADAVLLLVPRHPERFNEVINLASSFKFNIALRSENNYSDNTEVIIGNSMGELEMYFGMSDLIIMGGSFTEVGGHNPLEAIALNKPVLTGPHFFNFKEIYNELLKIEGAITLDTTSIVATLTKLLKEPNITNTLCANAYNYFTTQKGANQRTLQILEKILHLTKR